MYNNDSNNYHKSYNKLTRRRVINNLKTINNKIRNSFHLALSVVAAWRKNNKQEKIAIYKNATNGKTGITKKTSIFGVIINNRVINGPGEAGNGIVSAGFYSHLNVTRTPFVFKTFCDLHTLNAASKCVVYKYVRILFSFCRSQTSNKKPYMAAINALLLATGVCRAFVLFVDPYNTRRVSRRSRDCVRCWNVANMRATLFFSPEHFVRCHALDMGSGLMQLDHGSVPVTVGLFTTDSGSIVVLSGDGQKVLKNGVFFVFFFLSHNIAASGTFEHET